MNITLTGVHGTPTWKGLQRLINEALDTPGRLTRIRRDDGGCNYRTHGAYTLTFTPNTGDAIEIAYTVAP
jgi:hypothetical protein